MAVASVRRKNFNGITQQTVKHYQLGAGAYFKNVGRTETYAQAKAAGKCLGATQSGGEFDAKATIQQIQVDGAAGRVKGNFIVIGWEVSMKNTLLEVTPENLKIGLALADIDTTTLTDYSIITGKMGADDDDFLNICWMGCIAGTNEPIKIYIFNAFNENGLTFSYTDDGNGTIPLTLYGYNDFTDFENDEITAPFEIVMKNQATSTTPVVTAAGGDEMILLSWNAVTGATKYAVKSYASSTYTTVIDDLTATWYAVTGLTADTEYTYLVQAYVDGAWSPAENTNYNVTARTNAAT